MAARKYLITGGAGFIGSALARKLLGEGHQVQVLDDLSRGKPERLEGLGCSIFLGDVAKPRDVLEASHGCDSILHLAYLQGTQTFYSEPRLVLRTALYGMLNVLQACEQNGIGELLLVSSSEAYQVAAEVPTPEDVALTVPDPLNPRFSYGGGKIACEILASAWHRAGVLDRMIIARPHNIIGPDMGREHVVPEFCIRMNQAVKDHPAGVIPFPIQGTGQETRSFCHISDCVAQLGVLLEHAPDGIWHVGTEDERTIAEVAAEVAACYGRDIKVIPGTLPKGSPPRRCPDTAKISALGRLAGIKRQASFSDAIADTVKWYQAHG